MLRPRMDRLISTHFSGTLALIETSLDRDNDWVRVGEANQSDESGWLCETRIRQRDIGLSDAPQTLKRCMDCPLRFILSSAQSHSEEGNRGLQEFTSGILSLQSKRKRRKAAGERPPLSQTVPLIRNGTPVPPYTSSE